MDLSSNEISNGAGLENKTHLLDLNLCDNQIKDISFIKDASALTFISLSKNEITNLKPLESLVKLTSLRLDRNQIVSIEPLKELVDLESLNLQHNQIIDISPLEKLSKLRQIQLNHNNITTIPLGVAKLDKRIEKLVDIDKITTPPNATLKKGTAAIIAYWENKMGISPSEKQEEIEEKPTFDLSKKIDYSAFKALIEKPKGLTCNLGYPLEFGDMTFRLDEFDSLYDMLDILEIESFDDELLEKYPQYVALASADFELIDDFDSYAEFVLFVDTSSPDYPVVIFDSENEFKVVYETFDTFYKCLKN